MRVGLSVSVDSYQPLSAGGGPPSPLLIEARPSGPFWQDVGKTVPANVGDPVRVWENQGSGADLVAPSDAMRPLRDAAGGVDWNSATGSCFEYTLVHSGTASAYARMTRDATGDSEMVFVNPTAEDSYLWILGALPAVRIRGPAGVNIINHSFTAPTAESVISGVWGGADPNAWAAIDTAKTTTPAAGSCTGISVTDYIRIGSRYLGATDACKGQCRAFAFALAGHTNAEWLAMITYLNGLAP